ncbi:MAG: ABC transporter ATP-binding protein [Treponema sp.]|jgi:ABC-2 type transport system ATP-binding protein|nr:ABC transporter ATP-binding protein [Treponema sp.]
MLTVQGVTKVYGSRKVVDNISFALGDHEILGFLGPNGAGKSTTMNIIAGYTSSTSGTVTVNGCEILDNPIGCKKQIGYLPERPPLYPDMTVKDYLSFMFDLKKVKLPKTDHIAGICSAVGIDDVRSRIIKNLSKGYQQRVGLAQAMLGNPGILILDEPTVGLDPKQILEVRDLIRDMGKRCAVIFSSHILQEIQAVCERIIVINNGALIADDTPDNLARAASGGNRLLLAAEGPAEEMKAALAELPGMKRVEFRGPGGDGGFEFALESGEGLDPRRELFRLLAAKNWPALSLRKSGMSLEDVFLRLTAGDAGALSAFSRIEGADGDAGPAEGSEL